MTASTITGRVYVLGDNIDTDQIISAEYLKIDPTTEDGLRELGSLAMCGLPEDSMPFVDTSTGKSPYRIIVAGENFGCGSSREHAVTALGASGVKAVIAQSYARIFFRNCVSTGQLLPVASSQRLCDVLKTGDTIEIDPVSRRITCAARDIHAAVDPLGELAQIVEAGGLFAYGRKVGKVRTAPTCSGA
jgi:3-isopropylmalate/(R)-2-methylmalate dehydratase small subunit